MTDPTDETGRDDELAELRALARRVGPDDQGWESPPDGLWERIVAEAGVPADVARTTESDEGNESDARTDAVVRPLAPHRRRSTPWLLAAAAAVVVVGAIGALAISLSSSDDPTIVASIPLEPLGDAGEGTAELVDDDGSLQLRIEASGVDPGDGFLEVWVIDPEVTKLVSLGPLRADGVYDLPAGLDPASFPIVDVSVEPIDGDPAHSGDSVLRGQLQL